MSIDLMQHRKLQEKRNPFHGRFTHKTARFWFAKLIIFEERADLADRVFKAGITFRNKVVLPVKRIHISCIFHCCMIYFQVYYRVHVHWIVSNFTK